eukprot:EG_transcript_37343
MAPSPTSGLLLLLQGYFLLMNLTVERYYCHGPLRPSDDRFLVAQTIAFAERYNPLFLARPDWLVTATCLSAYLLAPGYLLIAVAALLNWWTKLRTPLLLFVGYKLYGVLFCHWMQFTSASPPPAPLPYFAVELPYVISAALVLYKVLAAGGPAPGSARKFGTKSQ